VISLATLAMIGWIPLILVSFSLLSPRRAVITAYIVGWSFLPVLSWDLPGLPSFNKVTATNLGVLAAVLLFDSRRMLKFRPGIVDLPMLVLCLCPIGSSLANGYGFYDGLSEAWAQVVVWAMPWVIGRCYFGSLSALRELAYGMFIGAVVYIPLCFFEMSFGAILHLKVYGYYQHDPLQTMRADGSVRPMVFMQHGLMLAMWMGSSALAGLALSREVVRGILPKYAKAILAAGLVVTTLLSRSMGASVLMLLGIATWFMARAFRVWFPVAILAACVPTYMTLRASGLLDVSTLTAAISSGFETAGVSVAEANDRVESARERFDAEDHLFARVRQDPLFGVGGWNFSRVRDPISGEMRSVITDGYWTIQLATHGLVGLSAWMLAMLLPVLFFVRSHPVRTWQIPAVSIAAALSLILLLYTLDCLLNAHNIPIYTLIAGGLVGLPALPRASPAPRFPWTPHSRLV
jgi:hypothetical protein